MKAKFDLSPTADNIMVILLLAGIVSILALCFNEAVIPMLVTFVLLFAVMGGAYYAFGGELTADEKGVTAVTTLFGKKIKKKFIEYGEIDRIDCGVQARGTRGWGIFYSMFLSIKMKGFSKYTVFKRLNISSSLPTNEPDKYKEYLHNQPLMQISHYIDSKLHLNTTA